MRNKNYERGRKKEYRVVWQLRKEGYDISQRTAGSHSAIDVIGVNLKEGKIKLIQVKPAGYSKKTELEKKWEGLNNKFNVEFEVR